MGFLSHVTHFRLLAISEVAFKKRRTHVQHRLANVKVVFMTTVPLVYLTIMIPFKT